MPSLLTAFLERSRVPDRERLQAAVTDLGFDLFIHVTYRPFHSSGILPCVLHGKRAAFEIGFDAPGLALMDFPRLQPEIGARDCAVSFNWGDEMADCACALIFAAALAQRFDAVVHYKKDDLVCSADRLIEDAQAAVRQSESEPVRSPTQLPKRPWWKFW